MLIATIFALLFSLFAFGFSLYTLWAVRVSPYRLIVYPPALSYLNPRESSLIFDLTFFNPGRVRVALLDMEVTLWSKNQQAITLRLKPQAYHQTPLPQGSLVEQHSVISRFTPFMINQQETASKTVYFSRSEMSPSALVNLEEDVHRICIAFKVNNRWNKKTFSLNYDGLQTDQRDKDSSSLLKLPFTPSFFPDVESLHLRGSIFDPVF